MCLITVSCNNKSELTQDKPEQTKNQPENPQNPYDVVGLLHNEALKISRDAYFNDNKTFSTLEIVDLSYRATQEVISNKFTTKLMIIDKDPAPSAKLAEEIVEELVDNKIDFIDDASCSNYSKDKIRTLYEDLLYIANGSSPVTYDYLHNYIISKEDEIINDNLISSADKEILLSTTSTLRYSLDYWESSCEVTKSGPHRKWWRWLLYGLADAGGAFVASGTGFAAVYMAVACSNVAGIFLQVY